MAIQPVPTFRAAHFMPYLDLMRSRRISIEEVWGSFKVPSILEQHPDSQIALLPALQFLAYINKKEGLSDPGLLASNQIDLKLLSDGNRRAILSAPTLKDALYEFQECMGVESNAVESWTTLDGSTARICNNQRLSMEMEDMRPLKIHFMLLTLAVVRAFAGPNWQPEVIGFRCRTPLSPVVGHRFPKTRFLFGQSSSWVSLPAHMLNLRKDYNSGSVLSMPVLPDSQISVETRNAMRKEDFVATLKSVLKAYLHDGYPSIELAAHISGRSVRTLQRNLAQLRMTYSKLVEDARFEAAVELLDKTGSKIIDIAYAVGYQDPSHFSRAFRRMAGTSPREYRLTGTM